MSKNLTRKGLALGAVVALGSTLFAGAPAFAAGEVTLNPTTGTEYKVLTLDDFTAVTALNSSVPAANIAQLKYKIEKTAAVTVVAAADTDTTFPTSSTGFLSLNSSTTSGVFAPLATSTTAANMINLYVDSATEDTATVTVDVTSFLDSDGGNDVDSGEFQVKQTITFVKPSEATFTTNLVQPYVAETSLVATVEIAGINLSQTSSVDIAFSKDGTTPFATEYGNATPANGTTRNATYSGTKDAAYDSTTTSSTFGKLTATYSKPVLTAHEQGALVTSLTTAGTAAFAVANDSKYQVQALATTAKGSASIKSVSAQTLATIATGVTAATGVKSTAGLATAAASTSTDSTVDVRSNVSGFEVFATFKDGTADADGGPKVIAGLPVTVVASTADSNVIAADGIKVGGKAFDDSTDVTLNLTTDANGQVKIAVTSTAIDSGDDIKFVFTAQGKTTATANSDTTFDGGVVTATWADATYSIIETADVTGVGYHTIAPKGSYTVEYKLFDQWGDAPADNAYRLSIALTNDSRTGNATWEYYPVVTGGKVSQTITDKLAGAESSITVTVGIQTYPAGSGYTSGAIDTASHTLVISDNATANAITLGNATVTDGTAVELKNVVASADQATNFTSSNKNYRLSQKDFANYDGRTSTATAPTVEQALALEINGTVQTGSFATGIAGVPVTISGTGLQFRAVVKGSDTADTIAASTALKNVYATNSLTLLSESDGDFGFQVWSHKSGSQTVTITAGGVSKTVALSFAALAAEANKAIVTSVPASVKAGRTVPVTAFVADKWGNGVPGLTVTFDSTGVGYLNATSGTTDANGKSVVRLLLGNGDVGLATVSAKYTQSSVDYSNSANALVGVSATVSAGKKLATAVVKNALGLTVKVVSGTKVVSKVATSDSFKVSLTKLTAGKKTVKVYVNDILVSSKSVTVKK